MGAADTQGRSGKHLEVEVRGGPLGTPALKVPYRSLKPKGWKGRKIVSIDWNEFKTGRSGHPISTDPTLHLDDGTMLVFHVTETEIGEYGVEMSVLKPGRVKA